MLSDIRPELLVYATEVLTCAPERVVSVLQQTGPITTWLIDNGSALAIKDHDETLIMRDGFSPGDSRVRPVSLALNRLLVSEGLGLHGSFPSSRFFVGFGFPNREEPHRMVTHCETSHHSPVRLRLHTYKDLGDAGFAKVRAIFEEWFPEATGKGFHGEILNCPEISMKRHAAPARYPFPRQLGWEICMPNANEVFFPWLELFFQLRRKLPKSQRVALQFV